MSDETILVTGGAGYIGSHTVRMLAEEAGRKVLVLDNLDYGHREAIISEGVDLIEGDMADEQLVASIFSDRKISAVIHFAAYTYVGESVSEPVKYYRNNTAAPLVILDAMQRNGCSRFIFSSTCATYGNPVRMPMDETHPQAPINPYGKSKWFLEQILQDCERAFGLKSVRLRYFNASGCSPDGRLGEDHDPETHIIPLVLEAILGRREKITVFGTDYPTPDGSCVRDYIHILDLASAHLRALEHLEKGGDSVSVNLGTGTGVSVKEIISIAEEVTGKKAPVEYGDRREGDPPELVADPSLAREVLGWEAKYKDVRETIETAWAWVNGPNGGRY
ncbi:MAG: UDP-glucose 4-epimerase GalE [Verrucomicrobiota bacterium]